MAGLDHPEAGGDLLRRNNLRRNMRRNNAPPQLADGIQRPDGSVEGAITVVGDPDGHRYERLILTSSAEARGLTRALIAATDDFDRMT